ncbi:MAG: hypothetical protein M3Y77_19625, partial [Actinomycetota bacterium]|nr:hypothetical protein [Actinomycetota bacterium]
LAPIRVRYHGMGGSLGGVFAQGFPSESLRSLRERLHISQRPAGAMAASSVDHSRVRDTAHASLLIFRWPSLEETPLAEYVSRWRERDFGTVEASRLSLVQYRPTTSGIGMKEVAQIALR